MGCSPELVSAFLDGELDRVILGSVTDHLLGCDDCCQMMSQLAQIRDGMADHFVLDNPEGMTQSVMMAIRNEKVLPDPHRFSRRFRRLGVPMMLVVAALLAEHMPLEADQPLPEAALFRSAWREPIQGLTEVSHVA